MQSVCCCIMYVIVIDAGEWESLPPSLSHAAVVLAVMACVCLIIESDVLILRKQLAQSKYQPVIIYRRRRRPRDGARRCCLFNSAFCAKHDLECDLTIGGMYSLSAFAAACGIISKAADAPALRLECDYFTFCEPAARVFLLPTP